MRKKKKKIDLFLQLLSESKFGSIVVVKDKKTLFQHIGSKRGPSAEILIKSKKCIDDFFLKGDLGWAES